MIVYLVSCYDCNKKSVIITEKQVEHLYCPNCSSSKPVHQFKQVPMVHDINEFKGHLKEENIPVDVNYTRHSY